MTAFARMNRSDHSMLPPTPAATMAYKSPNACNICHKDKDAAWADKFVRQWRTRDYQAPILKRAALVDAARKRDWSKLPEMLAYINDPKTAMRSLPPRSFGLSPRCRTRRSLPRCSSRPKIRRLLCVRQLSRRWDLIPTTESLQALIEATGDEYRLVRVRAAAGIAAFPRMTAPVAYQAQLQKGE